MIVVEEAPSHRHAMQEHLPIRHANSFYTGASGGLGWALPASVGIKLARPERPALCLIGDGSAMYSPQALWSAVESDAPIVVVVLNNGGYGAMKGFAALTSATGGPSYDIGHLDLAALATAQGCDAARVATPSELEVALERAFASNRPTLINISLRAEAPTFA
ncbi:MAG TPA: thiamine pyrophosphate-dependent enzyme [Trueperaceae bacterium]|nr:thiamine pyrophosphate-dependent enzyme [Trueperaceae bacterium]